MTLFFAYFVFFLSGVSALIYEVVWFRMFDLHIGVSFYAGIAVITAFMTGLAVGSKAVGKFADKSENPLLLYGWLEVAIGIYCLFLRDLIVWAASLQGFFYESMLTHPALAILFRFLIVLIVLFPATFLMGGTLPLLARFCSKTSGAIGRHISILYAVNTGGAAFGAWLAGFSLIPLFGLDFSSNIAGAMNILIGILAWGAGKRFQAVFEEGETQDHEVESSSGLKDDEDRNLDFDSTPYGDRQLMAIASLCGFVSLGLQVCWNRLFPLVIGASTYSFSIVLSAFLAGLTLGSIILSIYNPEPRKIPALAGYLLLFVGFSVAISLPVFAYLPVIFVKLRASLNVDFSFFSAIQYLFVLSIILPPTAAFGALFPLLARYFSRLQSVGHQIGRVYLWNSFGTIGGVVLTGFFVIPLLGIKGTMVFLLFMTIIAAIYLLSGCRELSVTWSRCFVIIALLSGIVFTLWWPWKSSILTSGVFRYWSRGTQYLDSSASVEQLFYEESSTAVVNVEKEKGLICLKINGKPDAGTGKDMATQSLLGLLPVVLSASPAEVLVVGVGSGVTIGALLTIDSVKHVDALELYPSVIRASHFFEEFNGKYWEDARVSLIEEDARSYVTYSQKTFDVIISEPSNPWMAGVGNLFTEEAFKLFRKRLNPGGIVCQWVQRYEMSFDVFSTIVHTFRSVFPNCLLVQPMGADIILIGLENDSACVSLGNLSKLFENKESEKCLKVSEIDNLPVVESMILMDGNDITRFIGLSDFNCDNFPVVEYQAPMDFYYRRYVDFPAEFYSFVNPASYFSKKYKEEDFSSSQLMSLALHWADVIPAPLSANLHRKAFKAGASGLKFYKSYLKLLSKQARWDEAMEIGRLMLPQVLQDSDFASIFSCAYAFDLTKITVPGPIMPMESAKVLDMWAKKVPLSWRQKLTEGKMLRWRNKERALASLLAAVKLLHQDPAISGVKKISQFAEIGEIINSLKNEFPSSDR
jgi:spermidine synthase